MIPNSFSSATIEINIALNTSFNGKSKIEKEPIVAGDTLLRNQKIYASSSYFKIHV